MAIDPDVQVKLDEINASIGNVQGSVDQLSSVVSDGFASHDSRLSALESEIPPPSSGGGGDGFPLSGLIDVDSYSGSDTDKLDAAMRDAAAQTHKPTLYLSNRRWKFTRSITAYTGFKLTGANWSSIEQPRGGNPYATIVDIDLGGSTTAWLNFPSGSTFGCYVGNIAFEGSGTNTQWAAANPGVCWTSVFENLGFSAFKHVFGNPSKKFLMTAVVIRGYWNINNCYDTAVTVGGSDNTLFQDGGLIDSPPHFIGGPVDKYHVRLDYLSKSTFGPVYMTCDRVSGFKITGNLESSTQGHTLIWGARIEGRNANTPCRGSLIRVQGGGVTLRDCWLGFAMKDPSNGANAGDKGVVHLSRGNVLMAGCTYGKGTLAESVPVLYATGSKSRARVTDLMPAENIDTWAGKPTVQAVSGADLVVDGFNTSSGLPAGFVQSAQVI